MSGFELGDLADLIACPECHAKLVVISVISGTAESLVCTARECRLSFPVREGIPVLLVDEAELLEESVWQAAVGELVVDEMSDEDETVAGEESES